MSRTPANAGKADIAKAAVEIYTGRTYSDYQQSERDLCAIITAAIDKAIERDRAERVAAPLKGHADRLITAAMTKNELINEIALWKCRYESVHDEADRLEISWKAAVTAHDLLQRTLAEREAELAAMKERAEWRLKEGQHLHNQCTDEWLENRQLKAKLAEQSAAMAKATARYEFVRKLNPRQYAELWLKPDFDGRVDAQIAALAGGKD